MRVNLIFTRECDENNVKRNDFLYGEISAQMSICIIYKITFTSSWGHLALVSRIKVWPAINDQLYCQLTSRRVALGLGEGAKLKRHDCFVFCRFPAQFHGHAHTNTLLHAWTFELVYGELPENLIHLISKAFENYEVLHSNLCARQ